MTPSWKDAAAHYRAPARLYDSRHLVEDGEVNNIDAIKQQLPFPLNQDMSQVLRQLDRRTPIARERLANDPVTAAYIAAAMRLIKRHLGPDPERTPVDSEDESSLKRPLLSFLSQRAVVAEVANNPDPLPRRGSISTLRSTWKSHSDFIADVLRFALWELQSPSALHYDDEIATRAEQLIEGPDFVEAVHGISYWNHTAVLNSPVFRLLLLAAATCDGDSLIQKAVDEHWRGNLDKRWKQVYIDVLRARDLRLRPGLTLDDVADFIAALGDGMTLRALADPSFSHIDRENQRCRLGTAILTLLLGCLEDTGGTDHQSPEEALHAVVYGHATDRIDS